jgi:hypothetical protein
MSTQKISKTEGKTSIPVSYRSLSTGFLFQTAMIQFDKNMLRIGDSGIHVDTGVTSPSFCTKFSERVYITALGCEIAFGTMELQAAGAGGL